jgi:hypothetical protein
MSSLGDAVGAVVGAGALALAWGQDGRFGEPRNAWHPVAWFARACSSVGRALAQLCPAPAIAPALALALAPRAAGFDLPAWCGALEAAAPSWPLSTQAEAMLRCWARPVVRRWVAESPASLAHWKGKADLQQQLAVRGATSFGLPGAWRVSAQPPAAQAALLQAIDECRERTP